VFEKYFGLETRVLEVIQVHCKCHHSTEHIFTHFGTSLYRFWDTVWYSCQLAITTPRDTIRRLLYCDSVMCHMPK